MYGATGDSPSGSAARGDDHELMYVDANDELRPIGSAGSRTSTVLDEHLKASFGSILFAYVLTTCGSGILSLPNAANNGSLVMFLALIAFFGVVSGLTARITTLACALANSASYSEAFSITLYGPIDEEDPTEPLDGRDALMKRTLRHRRLIAGRCVDCLAFLCTTAFVVGFLRNIIDTMPHVMRHWGVTGEWVKRWPYLFVLFGLFTPIAAMRSLRELTVTNVIGMLTIVAFVLAMVIMYIDTGGDGYSSQEARDDIVWIDLKPSFMTLPGTIMAAFLVQIIVPQMSFEYEHRAPSRFCRIITPGNVIMTLVYGTAGTIGYLTFGTDVSRASDDGTVLNNYPDTQLWTVMRLAVVLHFVCAAPIFIVNTRLSVYRLYLALTHDRERATNPTAGYDLPVMLRLAHSASSVAVLCLFAWLVPNVGQLISIGGVYFGTAFILLLPGILGLVLGSGVWQGTRAALETGDPELYLPSRRMQAASVGYIVLAGIVVLSSILTEVGVISAVVAPERNSTATS